MKRIIFRADGTSQTGMGHIMRSLALAEMLSPPDDSDKPGFDRHFAIRQPSEAVLKTVAKLGIPVIALQTNELDEFLRHVTADDVVVLDGYAFDEAFQQAVRKQTHKLVFIDDLMLGKQVADVVINHAGDVTPADYQTEPYTKLLLGAGYALVNPAFRQKAQPKDGENKAFVNMGGADPHNVSREVVELLLTQNAELRVTVVLGSANPHADTFADLPKDRLSIQQNLSPKQMARAIGGSGLSIVAASTIAYEVATVSRPMIIIQTADNQSRLVSFMRDRHLTLGALTLPIAPDKFETAVGKARLTPTVFKQRLVFDGKAADRYRQVFHELAV
ncbi:UDP-2,4-diacetamido-2,4,6-trideoxy-beta-L-altropyranose hydrolase [uncultured Fibrella sp.]|uniref:UDP-2,4-diacetamido-2,4, 6-trideoxy-beta-L-altropyranose hydrolase n=1 Tax=uncultured Fibrella sp. TaxID=1284596 RepID=UPI0035CCA76F